VWREGCHTEASILELPVEAPTDDIRVEPYGAETTDDQAPGNKEEPQEAPNEKHEERSHVVPLSTSRIATMRPYTNISVISRKVAM
jgi:hypothetical protein